MTTVRDDIEMIGDLTSTEKGSAARANGDKPRVDLIPAYLWAERALTNPPRESLTAAQMLGDLSDWQARKVTAMELFVGTRLATVLEAAAVLEFGAQKYAAWNWTRGMKYSAVTASMIRHLIAIQNGQRVDAESGLPHWGHVVCNLIFLAHYEIYYKEGDDRPPEYVFAVEQPNAPEENRRDLDSQPGFKAP
jgi:hypothetical protein